MDQLLGTPSTFGGSGIGSGYVQRARVPTPLGGKSQVPCKIHWHGPIAPTHAHDEVPGFLS
jgi:hypothetical protein